MQSNQVAWMNFENAYVCSLRDRSQQKYWLQGLPAPEPAIFHSFAIIFQIDPGFYLGVVEVNDCAIILDHVHLLNAGNIVH